MTARTLGRRDVLLGAGAAAGAVTLVGAGASPAVADTHRSDRAVSGSWLISRHDNAPGDTSPVQTVVSFAGGGVFAAQDIAPLAPGGLGAWARHGRHGFRVTFWLGSAAENGQPAATTLVKVRGSVHDDTISGTYTYQAFLAGTSTVVVTGAGVFTGARITA
ncbi:MAG: hypothetical protein QOF82_1787 [Frankiales bacterium]|nr:hypothetical protein [Frankiales bacterium]